MNKNNIEVIQCESGDWIVLKVNGEIEYEGHSIPVFVWLNLLNEHANFNVRIRTITNKEMKNK